MYYFVCDAHEFKLSLYAITSHVVRWKAQAIIYVHGGVMRGTKLMHCMWEYILFHFNFS